MRRWMERAHREIQESLQQSKLALNNFMEAFLDQMARAVSLVPAETDTEKQFSRDQFTHFARGHGSSRAGMKNYTIEGLIREYHILRQTICDVLEEEHPISPREREVITSLIEQAVNDAASEYARTLRELRERFTATLVHDLRNPITAAQLSAQMIERKPVDASFNAEHARKIIERLNHASSIIEDVLDMSRLSAGEMPPMPPDHCDLGEIIARAASDANQQDSDRVLVETRGELSGYWNARAIRRIVDNLLANALKFGTADRPVLVTLEGIGGEIILRVQNFGSTIAPEDQETIFQPFRRAASSGTKKGWGLGLVIVKALAEAHGGSVRVESSPEAGTTFVVTLPRGSRPSLVAS